MAPAGTVMSSGPSRNEEKAFSRPRISTAFPDMFRLPLVVQDGFEQRDEVAASEPGLRAFADGLAEQLARAFGLGLAAPVGRPLGHEGPETLASEDDAFALELFVGAFDRDDADEEIFRELAERGQRRARPQPSFADLALEAVDDLLVERTGTGRGERRKNQRPAHVGHSHCIYCLYTVVKRNRVTPGLNTRVVPGLKTRPATGVAMSPVVGRTFRSGERSHLTIARAQ